LLLNIPSSGADCWGDEGCLGLPGVSPGKDELTMRPGKPSGIDDVASSPMNLPTSPMVLALSV
jgi:hypothetical protein